MQKISLIESILMCIMVVMMALVCLPGIRDAQATTHRQSCANNLKQMGLVMKMYANESAGNVLPPLSATPGNWSPDIQAIVPEYLGDYEVLICPSSPLASKTTFRRNNGHGGLTSISPDCINSAFYVYTGFMLTDDYDAVALVDTWKANSWESLRQSSIPIKLPYALNEQGRGGGGMYIMWDRGDLNTRRMAHAGQGMNILYMDGHVEYAPYHPKNPTYESPMTQVFSELFGPIPNAPYACVSLN